MATSYPGSLDAFTNPTGSDTLDNPDHATQHADANDAIEALEAKVGTGAGSATEGKILKGGATAGSTAWSDRDIAFVAHGATAATARPAAATRVLWEGSVAPTNATSGDYWWDTTADLMRRYDGTGWDASNELLAEGVYDPASLTTFVPTSTSFADVDAANMAVSFTVPPSGIVVVEWSFMVIGAASTILACNLREASSDVADADRRMTGYTVIHNAATFVARIAGLTAGTATTWKLGASRPTGTGAVQVAYGGAAGPAIVRVKAGKA